MKFKENLFLERHLSVMQRSKFSSRFSWNLFVIVTDHYWIDISKSSCFSSFLVLTLIIFISIEIRRDDRRFFLLLNDFSAFSVTLRFLWFRFRKWKPFSIYSRSIWKKNKQMKNRRYKTIQFFRWSSSDKIVLILSITRIVRGSMITADGSR